MQLRTENLHHNKRRNLLLQSFILIETKDMNLRNSFLLSMVVIMLISCEKENNISTDVSENFIGNWINPVMVDSNWMYERSRFLKDNEYGFSLKTEDIFIERKYAGWCGTPPAAYSDFN